MATYKNGITGAFSGKVGAVVGVYYRGIAVMRTAPKKRTKPATVAQLLQQAKMSKVMQLLNPIKELIAIYFGTSVDTRSQNNLAVSYYLTEVVHYQGDDLVVLYERMMFAQGVLQFLRNLECVLISGTTLEFSWTDNSIQGGTKSTDQLIVVIFNPEKEAYAYYNQVGTRVDELASVVVPSQFLGDDVHVYAFMAAVNGKSNSSSWYLGRFLVG